MSNQVAIRLSGVGKMYRIYPSRLDNFLDALNLARFMPWRRIKPREFWALRDINFELKKGSRLGIIGRNGAGKSTLLKLITGNLPPTEGEVEVNGQVQALLEAGAGFHPEFTGYENIRAALTYQGFTPKEIDVAIEDITEFTELGQFLAQPFKTYSAGMQARLVFATATTLKPDILIVDEILGAGDAYFAGKSAERMKQLVEESGASVLLVSHAMDQILRYCDECIWIERGRIVKRGSSLEIIKAYTQFIQVLDDRRMKANNRKRRSPQYQAEQYDSYSDNLVIRLTAEGPPQAHCDVTEIKLWENDQIHDQLRIGDAQDTNTTHSSFLIFDSDNWSEPQQERQILFRSLKLDKESSTSISGRAIFYFYHFLTTADYAIELNYRSNNLARLLVEIWKNGSLYYHQELPVNSFEWMTQHIYLESFKVEYETLTAGNISAEKNNEFVSAVVKDHSISSSSRTITKWPTEGYLTIEEVLLLDAEGHEQTVFQVNTLMMMRLTFKAHKSGNFELIPVAVLFRLDGILVSRHIGTAVELELCSGECRVAQLDFGSINLGNGSYVFSVALYQKLDIYDLEKPQIYDLIDRSYEFEVFGTPPLETGIFKHPGQWKVI